MMMRYHTARIFGIWHVIFYIHKAALQEGCERAIVSLKYKIKFMRGAGKILVLVGRRRILAG